jgi:DNA-directed RNA polymerase III subunit RPC8
MLTTCVDTIRIPSHMLAVTSLVALQSEIDLKYPNRVLMDYGLVICRYRDCLKITHGSCVPGDGGSHHECWFRLVIFRPFVEEVCLGKIVKSTPEGIQVSLGFFQDIFIPAYWMLRPSHYDDKIGLWVWTPKYDEEEDDDEEKDDVKEEGAPEEGGDSSQEETTPETSGEATAAVKVEEQAPLEETAVVKTESKEGEEKENSESDRFEMEIGSEIRFKVKSIHFTQVTTTAKGVQATTTTTAHSHSFPKEKEDAKTSDKPLRKRSSSVDLSAVSNLPASMHIVASICEDGLGLTSWWAAPQEEDDEEGSGDAEEGEEAGDDDDAAYEEEYI